MRRHALLINATGQDGTYLSELLANKGYVHRMINSSSPSKLIYLNEFVDSIRLNVGGASKIRHFELTDF